MTDDQVRKLTRSIQIAHRVSSPAQVEKHPDKAGDILKLTHAFLRNIMTENGIPEISEIN